MSLPYQMNLKTALLDWQQRGVDKLLPIRVGALFMEQGTGKTRTAIELVHRRQSQIDKVVYFCPVSLKLTVYHQILQHTDTPSSQMHIFDDRTDSSNIPRVGWYIIGIESMSASSRVVMAVNELITSDTFVITDESDYIKGHKALRTERITRIAERCRYRLILTGTPISQGVIDLFSQMRFLSPKILGYRSFYSFAANHLEYSDKYPGLVVRGLKLDWLAQKIQPYVYQVTKVECVELPKKLYTSRFFYLSRDQHRAYQQAKEELLLSVDEPSSYDIFRTFTALQQIVSGYWNYRGIINEYAHSRLDQLMHYVDGLGDEKVIVWCKFQYSVNAIAAALRGKYGNDSTSEFHGKINQRERDNQIDRFRKGSQFLVATQSSGGRGLTLTESHHAVFYENEFRYANRLQAEDRQHRLGTTEHVTYCNLWSESGIDRLIMQSHDKKGNAVHDFKRQIDRVKDDKKMREKMIQDL